MYAVSCYWDTPLVHNITADTGKCSICFDAKIAKAEVLNIPHGRFRWIDRQRIMDE